MSSEILSKCETFYQTLYTPQGSDNKFFQLENDTSWDENDSASCEGLLTMKESLRYGFRKDPND